MFPFTPGKNTPHREALSGCFETKRAQFFIQHQNFHFGFAFPILILNIPHLCGGKKGHFIVNGVALAMQKKEPTRLKTITVLSASQTKFPL